MPHFHRQARLEALCAIIVMSIASAVVGWAVVTFALSQLRAPVLRVAFASRLAADYGEAGASEIAPIGPSVILSVNRDDKPPAATKGKARFVPIFTTSTGSQLPGTAPAAEQAAASPTPPASSPVATIAGAATVAGTVGPKSTSTPAPGGSPTRTPAPSTGTPQPTNTAPPSTDTPIPQPTNTPAGQIGNPAPTRTPNGNGGGPLATNTPKPTNTPNGTSGGPVATNTPNGTGGGPPATNTPKPTNTPRP